MFFSSSRSYSTKSINEIALIAALWIVLAFTSIAVRPLMANGLFPVFYFLVWISGLLFPPKKAFVTTFIGHFLFDVFLFFNVLFIFVWLASALASVLISWAKNHLFSLGLVASFLMPLLYVLAFCAIGSILLPSTLSYFWINPTLTFGLVILNPIFNFLLFYYFVRPNFATARLRRLLTGHE